MTFTLKEISQEVEKQKKLGKKAGLITGCFDIIHSEHIQLFRFAKQHVDFLVVGLENDETISLSKGKNRPVNKIEQRAQVVSELESVDAVFEIKPVYDCLNVDKAEEIQFKIRKTLAPNCLITAIKADKFWQPKKKGAARLQIEFIPDKKPRHKSSTKIIEKLTK